MKCIHFHVVLRVAGRSAGPATDRWWVWIPATAPFSATPDQSFKRIRTSVTKQYNWCQPMGSDAQWLDCGPGGMQWHLLPGLSSHLWVECPETGFGSRPQAKLIWQNISFSHLQSVSQEDHRGPILISSGHRKWEERKPRHSEAN